MIRGAVTRAEFLCKPPWPKTQLMGCDHQNHDEGCVGDDIPTLYRSFIGNHRYDVSAGNITVDYRVKTFPTSNKLNRADGFTSSNVCWYWDSRDGEPKGRRPGGLLGEDGGAQGGNKTPSRICILLRCSDMHFSASIYPSEIFRLYDTK